MKKQKSNKTIQKKFKKTGKGKVTRRSLNQGHFNAKESGNKTRKKRSEKTIPNTCRKLKNAL